MSNEAAPGEQSTTKQNVGPDTSDRVAEDHYDRGIVPAETAARLEREGNRYKEHPREAADADPESIHTTDGYTVDKEGLLNNYAIEPEMYVNEPGDLKQKEEELTAQRVQELEDAQEDKQGDLTLESDKRGRGPGII